MGESLTRKIIKSHLAEGRMVPGEEIGIRIDQTLIQDLTGIRLRSISARSETRSGPNRAA